MGSQAPPLAPAPPPAPEPQTVDKVLPQPPDDLLLHQVPAPHLKDSFSDRIDAWLKTHLRTIWAVAAAAVASLVVFNFIEKWPGREVSSTIAPAADTRSTPGFSNGPDPREQEQAILDINRKIEEERRQIQQKFDNFCATLRTKIPGLKGEVKIDQITNEGVLMKFGLSVPHVTSYPLISVFGKATWFFEVQDFARNQKIDEGTARTYLGYQRINELIAVNLKAEKSKILDHFKQAGEPSVATALVSGSETVRVIGKTEDAAKQAEIEQITASIEEDLRIMEENTYQTDAGKLRSQWKDIFTTNDLQKIEDFFGKVDQASANAKIILATKQAAVTAAPKEAPVVVSAPKPEAKAEVEPEVTIPEVKPTYSAGEWELSTFNACPGSGFWDKSWSDHGAVVVMMVVCEDGKKKDSCNFSRKEEGRFKLPTSDRHGGLELKSYGVKVVDYATVCKQAQQGETAYRLEIWRK